MGDKTDFFDFFRLGDTQVFVNRDLARESLVYFFGAVKVFILTDYDKPFYFHASKRKAYELIKTAKSVELAPVGAIEVGYSLMAVHENHRYFLSSSLDEMIQFSNN